MTRSNEAGSKEGPPRPGGSQVASEKTAGESKKGGGSMEGPPRAPGARKVGKILQKDWQTQKVGPRKGPPRARAHKVGGRVTSRLPGHTMTVTLHTKTQNDHIAQHLKTKKGGLNPISINSSQHVLHKRENWDK